jgi:hypothetical protein
MSNDSNYTIKLKGRKDQVDAVLNYLEQKSARWREWQDKFGILEPKKRHKALNDALKTLGLKKSAEFVSWGFTVETRDDKPKASVAVLSVWANESSTNCSVSGVEGELAVIYEKFPSLDYSVEYNDEYSSGVCHPPYFEKEPSEESAGTLDRIAIDLYSDGGEETLMDCLGTKTSQYKTLEDGVAEFIFRHWQKRGTLKQDIDLSGIEKLSRKDAAFLAKCKRIKVLLNPEMEEFVGTMKGEGANSIKSSRAASKRTKRRDL